MISVIIPTYNREALISESLNSLLKQTYENWECIIVDDGSTDNSKKIIQEFVSADIRFKFVERPKKLKKGANSCRRLGLEYTNGVFIKWLDSDDLLHPATLEIQLNQIIKGKFDVVFCNSVVYNHDFSKVIKIGWSKNFYSDDPIKDYLLEKLSWSTPSGLWRKQQVLKLNPFSENISNSQEWLFHLKALFHGFNIGISSQELVLVRSHNNSVSNKLNRTYWKTRFKSRLMAGEFVSNYDKRYVMFINESLKYMYIHYKLFFSFGLNFKLLKSYLKIKKNKQEKMASDLSSVEYLKE